MTRRNVFNAFALTLLLAIALPAGAAKKSTKELRMSAVAKGKFNVVSSLSLSGSALKPGEYDVVASDSQVSFFRDGKLIAKAPIQWKDGEPSDYNAIVDDGGSVREVRFKGNTRSIMVTM